MKNLSAYTILNSLTSVAILLIGMPKLSAQTSLLDQVEYEKVNNKLFLNFPVVNGDTIAEYSIDENDNFLNLYQKQSFTQKNHITLNVSWLNPINFQVIVKDTLTEDPTSKVVDDFIKNLTGQFSIPAFGSDDGLPTPTIAADPILRNYNDLELLKWNILLKKEYTSASATNQKKVEAALNYIDESLKEVDKYVYNDDAAKSGSVFKLLQSISDPYVVIQSRGGFKKAEMELEKLITSNEKANSELDKLTIQFKANKDDIVGNLSFASGLSTYTIALLKDFQAKAKLIIDSRSKSNKALSDLINVLKKSCTGSNVIEQNNRIYTKVKDIRRNRGKITQVDITLKKMSYVNDDFITKSEKTHSNYQISFQPYRFLIPVVSVGVFYSSLRQTTFEAGVDNDGNTIVEEVQNDSGPVYSSNLNLYLNTKNSDFLPFFQLGIDPTKERPFLLSGLGLAIPSSRFALSGGVAWTWQQSLQNFTVGGQAESEAAIKDDLKYEFDPVPRIYLGLQFEF